MPLEDTGAAPTSAIHQKWEGDTLMQFKPERWLDDEGQFDSQVGSQSAPFSGGQRGCFGKALAVSLFLLRSTYAGPDEPNFALLSDAGTEDYAS
jgi:hypothetical protein